MHGHSGKTYKTCTCMHSYSPMLKAFLLVDMQHFVPLLQLQKRAFQHTFCLPLALLYFFFEVLPFRSYFIKNAHKIKYISKKKRWIHNDEANDMASDIMQARLRRIINPPIKNILNKITVNLVKASLSTDFVNASI